MSTSPETAPIGGQDSVLPAPRTLPIPNPKAALADSIFPYVACPLPSSTPWRGFRPTTLRFPGEV